MNAIEFTAIAHDGIIDIPAQYRDQWDQKFVRVIFLEPEPAATQPALAVSGDNAPLLPRQAGALKGMSGYTPKLIDGNHYLLWTDALHARELARQASNKWDKAAYVRWTILLSWTVLEIACQDALDNPKVSYSFQKIINDTIQEKNLASLNWGSGVWQKVTQLQNLRKDIVHRFANESNLFPDADIADFSINISREAVIAIYEHTNKPFPSWINDDNDTGWCGKAQSGSAYLRDNVTATVIKKGAIGVENPLKVYYIANGKERLSDVLSPDDDPAPYIEHIRKNSIVPISEIKVLRGKEIVFRETYTARKESNVIQRHIGIGDAERMTG